MKSKLTRAVLIIAGWLVIVGFVTPSICNWRFGSQSSLLRFDPEVSTDYNCIFVEGYSLPRFAIPWISRSTPVDYLRIRYTPHAGDQPYGIMFVDPRTLAYEAHSGFVQRPPTQLSGRLDSPVLLREWMRSQAQSSQDASHDGDAQEIYAAIIALSKVDLEHFTLSTSITLSHFQIGHTATCLVEPYRPSWTVASWLLIFIWFGVFRRKKPTTERVRES